MEQEQKKEALDAVTEQEERRRALNHAVAAVRLEGLEPVPEFFTIAERYVAGEMTLAEMTSAVRQLFPNDDANATLSECHPKNEYVH